MTDHTPPTVLAPLYRLDSPIRHYAWGSATLLARLQDRTPSGQPEAELWMGAHPAAPSSVTVNTTANNPDSTRTSASTALDALIASAPEATLGTALPIGRAASGAEPQLPYLVKLLAAEQPLSIQAHPDRDQARAGWDAENTREISLNAAVRNYKDPNHKPEMLVALTDFSALCGFRPPVESADSFARLATLPGLGDAVSTALREFSHRLAAGDLKGVFTALLDPEGPWADDVESPTYTMHIVEALQASSATQSDTALATAVRIAEHHPQDPGVLVSVLMNRVQLAAGEAIFLTAGMVHAYLSGLGLETMAASDNVLRGGLTSKHIDVAELQRVVDFTPTVDPRITATLTTGTSPGVTRGHFDFPVEDFDVTRVDFTAAGTQDLSFTGPQIIVCTAGGAQVAAASDTAETTGTTTEQLSPGQSVFVPAATAAVTLDTTEHPTTVFVIGCSTHTWSPRRGQT